MANWDNPKITTQYDVFLAECKERDLDTATMFKDAPTNPPVSSIRLFRSPLKLQEWTGSAWADRLLSIEGGGTGSNNAAGIRTNLGLGTIAVQNANLVAITGGTIQNLTYFQVACTILVTADNAFDIGSYSFQFRKGYFRSALVIPSGTDKYATS